MRSFPGELHTHLNGQHNNANINLSESEMSALVDADSRRISHDLELRDPHPYVRESDTFLKECIERCANTSYLEHLSRGGIIVISFVGSALFFFGVKQFVEETLGDNQVYDDLGIFLGITGLTLSALPLAGLGVTTAQDMQSSSDAEKAFLEPTKRSKGEYFLRWLGGLISAMPMGGLSFYVLKNSRPVIKWGGTFTAFLGLAFGTIPSMLGFGKSAPNELKADECDLSAEQLSVLERMHTIMQSRIEANQYKIARLAHDNIPQNSCELLKLVLAEPAPSYGPGLDAFIISGTMISFAGLFGYAGSMGLFFQPLFSSLPTVWSTLGNNITTALCILAFGNLMRLSCKGGFSDLYRLGVATYSAIVTRSTDLLRNFMQNEIYASRFFPVAAPTMTGTLAVLGSGTGFTNARTCYLMTFAVLNAITFGRWQQWGLEKTTEVIRWMTAVCGFINSDFFNGRGSIIAVLNVFLLRYGHILLNDDNLKEVLKNFNGSQLYLRRVKENVPVGKSMLLLDNCGNETVASVLEEATEKVEGTPSITMGNWPEVVGAIKAQRIELRLSGHRARFLNNRQPDEESHLLTFNTDPLDQMGNSSSCCPKMCVVM